MIDTDSGLTTEQKLQAFSTRARASSESTDATTDAPEVDKTEDNKDDKKAEGSEFDAVLRGLLIPDQANNVSEEDLFAGLVQERIKKLKGDGVADQYNTVLAEKRGVLTRSDGFVSSEGATVSALQAMVAQGALTTDEADKIYSQSFEAAQLDGNTDALYDSRGGPGDPTMAIDQLENALLAARMKIEQYDAGTAEAATRHVADGSTDGLGGGGAATAVATGAGAGGPVDTSPVTPSGTTVDGANGFLFKPVSDNQGTLAVLMPEALAQLVSSLVIKDPTGTVLEEGFSTGYGDLGTREKFSFQKPGGEYPANLTVEATLSDGSVKTWTIPDPSQRYD